MEAMFVILFRFYDLLLWQRIQLYFRFCSVCIYIKVVRMVIFLSISDWQVIGLVLNFGYLVRLRITLGWHIIQVGVKDIIVLWMCCIDVVFWYDLFFFLSVNWRVWWLFLFAEIALWTVVEKYYRKLDSAGKMKVLDSIVEQVFPVLI